MPDYFDDDGEYDEEGSLTPYMEKLEEINSQFIATDRDLRELRNTRISVFDEIYLDILEKHHPGQYPPAWDAGAWEDEPTGEEEEH